MWGDEPQLEAFRERLKVLLEAHEQDLNPQVITAEEGTVLCRQGEPVDTLMLLRERACGRRSPPRATGAHTRRD